MPYTAYEAALRLFRFARTDDFFVHLYCMVDGTRRNPDAAEPCPVTLPDQFIPGPTFAALGCEIDYDGHGEWAKRIDAPNLAEAKRIADETMDGVYDVVPLRRDLFSPDNDNWSEYEYFMDTGYASIGDYHLNAIGRDDSVGTIYDHTYDY